MSGFPDSTDSLASSWKVNRKHRDTRDVTSELNHYTETSADLLDGRHDHMLDRLFQGHDLLDVFCGGREAGHGLETRLLRHTPHTHGGGAGFTLFLLAADGTAEDQLDQPTQLGHVAHLGNERDVRNVSVCHLLPQHLRQITASQVKRQILFCSRNKHVENVKRARFESLIQRTSTFLHGQNYRHKHFDHLNDI